MAVRIGFDDGNNLRYRAARILLARRSRGAAKVAGVRGSSSKKILNGFEVCLESSQIDVRDGASDHQGIGVRG
jgi:hypothetical protein